MADFLRQLTTLKAVNARNEIVGLRAVGQFGTLFAGTLYDSYGGVFSKPTVFDPAAPPRRKRALDLPVEPEVYQVDAGDGVLLRLTRYRGGRKGPLMCVHGLGVSSKIFSTDLIERNLLEELVANKYDVWLLDYRSSIDLPYAARQYSADDVAIKDFPAAVSFIRKTAGAPSIQCLVHCFGATTFFMAMLAGLQGVRAAAVSQIATDMVVPLASELKAICHAPDFLEGMGIEILSAYVDVQQGLAGKAVDQLLRFYPVHDGPRDVSAVSRRVSFIYGQLYEVDQLNQQTYDNLHELFGIASISSLKHLALMIRHKKIVNFEGGDSYLEEEQGMPNLKRLAIPIVIVQGEANKCWLTESTARSIERFSNVNDPQLYQRKLIAGYGHIDCIFGKNAMRDVYPFFIEHLDKTAEA
jgi:cholesterol oxidase